MHGGMGGDPMFSGGSVCRIFVHHMQPRVICVKVIYLCGMISLYLLNSLNWFILFHPTITHIANVVAFSGSLYFIIEIIIVQKYTRWRSGAKNKTKKTNNATKRYDLYIPLQTIEVQHSKLTQNTSITAWSKSNQEYNMNGECNKEIKPN